MQILIIEDAARRLGFVTGALRARGIAVSVACTGEDALALAISRDFSLAILDLEVPGLGGLEVLGEMAWRKPDLPVLVVSARADLQTKLDAFTLGARDFIERPFALDELLARVRVQLRRRHPDEGHILHAGDVDLDLARREVRVGDRVSPLTFGEFRLLQHLLEHAGDVLTREELLTDVWGFDFDARSNVVDACVGRLRKKLGPDAPLETVRNVGYRLRTRAPSGVTL